jgi:thiamine-phosphate pyrophosphorylase
MTQELLAAGAEIVQWRHKGALTRERFAELEAMAKLVKEAGARFVVNDRADLAKLTGAALHLGQDDLPPSEARKIVGPGAIIGFSTHNEAQLRAALEEPVDYLALGPMFGTQSKENPDPVVGVEELRRLRPLTGKPLVAIGGITRSNAGSVLAAGADSIAVIGDLFGDDGVGSRAGDWRAVLAGRSR